MPRCLTLLLIVLVACLGCSPASQHRGAPLFPTEDRYGAPPITHPRDLRAATADPCTRLFTSRQMRELGLNAPGRPERDATGAPTCSWNGIHPQKTVEISVWVGQDYLVDSYRNRIYDITTPTEVSGLPALQERERSGPSFCDIVVGVADRQSLDLSTSIDEVTPSGAPVTDPCAEGHAVAAAIVANLPAG